MHQWWSHFNVSLQSDGKYLALMRTITPFDHSAHDSSHTPLTECLPPWMRTVPLPDLPRPSDFAPIFSKFEKHHMLLAVSPIFDASFILCYENVYED